LLFALFFQIATRYFLPAKTGIQLPLIEEIDMKYIYNCIFLLLLFSFRQDYLLQESTDAFSSIKNKNNVVW